MTRSEFIKNSIAMGIGMPFLGTLLASCGTEELNPPDFQTDFSGKVIVVGAGAAGIAAAYLLQRYNVDFEVIEASAGFGGRVKRASDFVDFPIDIGAEWIHASPSILAQLIDDPSVDANIDFITYNPQTIQVWNRGKLRSHNYARNFYSEYKFKNTTWYGFFERYIVPSFVDKITYNQPIIEINYASDKVVLTSEDGNTYEADKVIVTVPIKVLQDKFVTFTPALPVEKSAAIDSIFMGDGLKVFIEFEQKFYPDIFFIGGLLQNLSGEERTFYDAAFRKEAKRHVLGLFSINSKAAPYIELGTDEAIFQQVMTELDEIFDGKASQYYVQHMVQNWSAEPYIRGSYSFDFEENQERTVDRIKEPVENKVYFAGEALSIANQATVHGACESGYEVVVEALG